MLVEKCWNCYNSKNRGECMRQQVLKALANPSRIFYVPFSLAVMNFAVQFLVFVAIFLTILFTSRESINPLWFFLSVCAIHFFISCFSKHEPQLAQILSAKINLFTSMFPGRLTAYHERIFWIFYRHWFSNNHNHLGYGGDFRVYYFDAVHSNTDGMDFSKIWL